MARDYPGAVTDYHHTTVNGLGGVTGDNDAFTLAGWFTTDTSASLKVPFMLFDTSGQNRIEAYAQGANVWFEDRGVTTTVSFATAVITANVPLHACHVIRSNTDREWYIDGVSKGSSTTDCGNRGLDRVAVGAGRRSTSSVTRPFLGAVSEVGLWNVALDDADVAALGAGYSPLFVRPDALVRYFPLHGLSDPEPDVFGNNGLTKVGTVPAARHHRIIQPSRNRVYFPPAAAPPATTPPKAHHRRMMTA